MHSEVFHHNKQAYEKFLSFHDLFLEICSPLFASTKFKTFGRWRFLLDQDQICTKIYFFYSHKDLAEWVIYEVMQNGNELNEVIRNTPEGEYNYYFSSLSPSDNVLSLYKEKFQVCNGVMIYKRSKDYIDAWGFLMDISDACSYAISNNLFHELQKWVNYFETVFDVYNIVNGPIKYFGSPHDYSYRPQQIFQTPHFSVDLPSIRENFPHKLSQTEWKCFQWVGKGRTMKEIGLELGISPRTVESHLNNIKRKTGVAFKFDLTKLYQKAFES